MHDRFPLPDPEFEPLAPFWKGAQEKKLLLPYNPETQEFEWYPKGEPSQYEWREVSGKGTLFSWVVVRHAFLPQYKSALPFIPALVALQEAPQIRLATRLSGISEPQQLKGNEMVEVVFEELFYEGVEDENQNPFKILAPFFKLV